MPNDVQEPEIWTIGRMLGWATEDLAKRGLDQSPRLDAQVLLCHALKLSRVQLVVDANRPLSAEELSLYRELIVRRRRAEPVAYILGKREFFGHSFRVNSAVLIPRPDTETLVNVALERTQSRSQYGRALDLCTGSGCVALSFAKQRPTWRVTGTDISTEALLVARFNALNLGAIWEVDFRESDLFEQLEPGCNYELITANPPYISDDDMRELSRDILDYEPDNALRGGPDGLVLLRKLVKVAVTRLQPGGILALELGAGQAARVAHGLTTYGLENVSIEKDYGGIERIVSGMCPR